jgi:ribosomal protein S5
MHVLNPEIFVMWDIGIRDRYKKKNRSVLGNSEGYLEFLKENQREIRDALNDGRKTTGKDLDEIERELRKEHENKTLAKLIDQYNYQIAHP